MRRILLTVFALLVLLPSVALAQAFLCRTDGQSRPRCCCHKQEAPAEPTIRKASCCEVTPASAPRTAPTVLDHAPSAPTATPAVVTIAPAPVVRIPDSLRAPPRRASGAPPPLSVRLLL